MTDAFTAASPTYRAAKATDQSRGRGWDFAPAAHRPSISLRVIKGFAGFLIFTSILWGLAFAVGF